MEDSSNTLRRKYGFGDQRCSLLIHKRPLRTFPRTESQTHLSDMPVSSAVKRQHEGAHDSDEAAKKQKQIHDSDADAADHKTLPKRLITFPKIEDDEFKRILDNTSLLGRDSLKSDAAPPEEKDHVAMKEEGRSTHAPPHKSGAWPGPNAKRRSLSQKLASQENMTADPTLKASSTDTDLELRPAAFSTLANNEARKRSKSSVSDAEVLAKHDTDGDNHPGFCLVCQSFTDAHTASCPWTGLEERPQQHRGTLGLRMLPPRAGMRPPNYIPTRAPFGR